MMSFNKDLITIGDKNKAKLFMIWFHGYGSNNWSFEPMLKLVNMNVNDDMYIVMPNAKMIDNKRSWYPLPTTTNDNSEVHEDFAGFKAAMSEITEFMVQVGIKSESKLLVGGFSQGAALSLGLCFQKEIDISGCIALSGYMPCAKEFMSNDIRCKKIFMSHGTEDNAISFESYERSYEFLNDKQTAIHTCTGDFGHTVTKDVTNELTDWILNNFIE